MTRKVTLTVEVTLSTNEDVLVRNLEDTAVLHTKNCLLDNPDAGMFYVVEDVDVSIVKSVEV